MIYEKLKRIYEKFIELQNQQIDLSNEILWANYYNDLIKSKPWLQNMDLSSGRWAANYSFIFLVTKLLTVYKPKKILEFGLGESSKLISCIIENQIFECDHHVIEHSDEWVDFFKKNNKLYERTDIIMLELNQRLVNGFEVNSYKNITSTIKQDYDFYIIDGPFGSPRYSRYDIVEIISTMSMDNEFVILIDDYNRIGESETAWKIVEILKSKGISIHTQIFRGSKSQLLIATDKYKYATSF